MEQKNAPPSRLRAMLRGIVYASGSMVGLSTGLALLFSGIPVTDSVFTLSVYGAHALAVFIGGYCATCRGGSRGWITGGMMGIVYSAFLLIIGMFLNNSLFNTAHVWLIGIAWGSGTIGSMVGVQRTRQS